MKQIVCLFSIIALAGCSCSDEPSGGPDGSTGMDAGPGTGMDAGPGLDSMIPPDGPLAQQDGSVVIMEDGGFTWTCVPVTCAGQRTECADCEDNDGDGLTDSRDPECLGPCDNTEGPALTTGVGGEGAASCNRDCYFDFGNGHGGQDCRWDTLCDPLEPDDECAYDAAEVGGMRCPMPQPANCLPRCRPLTPNGCDCFGCCTFDQLAGRSAAEGGEWVWLGSGVGDGPGGEGTCTFELIDDVDACHPCTPQMECFNDCGPCELCLGRTELPPECMAPDGGYPDGGYDGGYPPMRCPAGVQECGLPGEAPCPTDYYCVTGCCVATIF